MADAERDAWLREALRHAPDSGAVPPTTISAAILAEARAAAARPTAASALRRGAAAPAAHPLLALWSWLARPPVAAGFASVMAATLVGLMWWDRPMDETLPHPPALERSDAKRGTASASVDATTRAAAAVAPTAPTPPPTAPATAAESPATPAREAKVGDAAKAERARAKDELSAKERGALRKSDAPAPFPSAELERATRPAPQAADQDAKKQAAATPPPATSPAPFAAAERAAPAPAAPAAPAPAPQQSGRLAGDEARPTASNRADVAAAAAAKSVAPRSSATEPTRDAAAPAAAAPVVRQRSSAEARPNEVDAFASSGAAARSELQTGGVRHDGAAAPLAPLLAGLTGDSARWTRPTSSGGATTVEPAWRDWLAELDAAGAGRWQRVADLRQQAGADAEKQGTAALRLNVDGRPAAVVRIDGTTARVEIVGAVAEHWQAPLTPPAAERLRAALAHLPP
jgi:hypothetical protein